MSLSLTSAYYSKRHPNDVQEWNKTEHSKHNTISINIIHNRQRCFNLIVVYLTGMFQGIFVPGNIDIHKLCRLMEAS